MRDQIKALAKEYLPDIVACRRHIHANPELSFQEFNTSLFIQQKLSEYGISFKAGMVKTGIVAEIQGVNPEKRSIALRADMDALPILEQNEVPYKSLNHGVMHACGHDAHTSSLLGCARILHTLRHQWEGSVQFVFQPGEEVLPGGASLMIKEGLFKDKSPERIWGQHVFPELQAGKVGFKPGPYMASTDELYLVVKGKGGHGAKPDRTIDPVLIAAHLVIALQQVVSRWSSPALPTVLSIGKVIAEGATNIIPNEVRMEGTFRTFDESWRREAHRRMVSLANHLCEGMGGEVDFRIEVGYPVLVNETELTLLSRQRAIEFLGEENVVDLDLRTTAEDFAYFTQNWKGCFYRLGTSSQDGTKSFSVHNSRFDIDESALETGMGLMAWLAITE